jgi:hypothetical protein
MRRSTIPDSIGDLTALEYVLWLVMLPAHHGRCFELFTARCQWACCGVLCIRNATQPAQPFVHCEGCLRAAVNTCVFRGSQSGCCVIHYKRTVSTLTLRAVRGARA